MAITDKVRKELWGKSGNKCAICHIDLFRDVNLNSFNIGEECHIISERSNGPRHIGGLEDYDIFDNLILLCRNHHKEIDDPANISKYSIAELKIIKEKHEKWVKQRLSEQKEKEDTLPLIKNGNELVSILGAGIARTYIGNDEAQNCDEAEYFGEIWQEISDFIANNSVLEPNDISRKEFMFSQMLGEMTTKGFFLFGRIKKVSLLNKYGDDTLYNIAELFIKRIENISA